jgi:hypothetical protein
MNERTEDKGSFRVRPGLQAIDGLTAGFYRQILKMATTEYYFFLLNFTALQFI